MDKAEILKAAIQKVLDGMGAAAMDARKSRFMKPAMKPAMKPEAPDDGHDPAIPVEGSPAEESAESPEMEMGEKPGLDDMSDEELAALLKKG